MIVNFEKFIEHKKKQIAGCAVVAFLVMTSKERKSHLKCGQHFPEDQEPR